MIFFLVHLQLSFDQKFSANFKKNSLSKMSNKICVSFLRKVEFKAQKLWIYKSALRWLIISNESLNYAALFWKQEACDVLLKAE